MHLMIVGKQLKWSRGNYAYLVTSQNQHLFALTGTKHREEMHSKNVQSFHLKKKMKDSVR